MTAVIWRPRALKDLAGLPGKIAQAIVAAVDDLAADRRGDTKALKGKFSGQRRLRVGDWRVFYDRAPDVIHVLRVIDRKDAYR